MWPRNRYMGFGGGLYTGIGGGTYTSVGGGLYTGVGSGLFTGVDSNPNMSNWPPPRELISELQIRGMHDIVEYMLRHGYLDNC
jgi:hypothetical protein